MLNHMKNVKNKVYYHKKMSSDELLGRVDEEGKAYEIRDGIDKYIGRVDLESGKVYNARQLPEEYIGRVDLSTSKVYISHLGPDEYLGQVDENGKLYYHAPLARDPYLGRVEDMTSIAHGGAAYLLLIVPLLEQESKSVNSK